MKLLYNFLLATCFQLKVTFSRLSKIKFNHQYEKFIELSYFHNEKVPSSFHDILFILIIYFTHFTFRLDTFSYI